MKMNDQSRSCHAVPFRFAQDDKAALRMTELDITAALWQGDRVPLIVTGGGRYTAPTVFPGSSECTAQAL
jgi:hypothetical protein